MRPPMPCSARASPCQHHSPSPGCWRLRSTSAQKKRATARRCSRSGSESDGVRLAGAASRSRALAVRNQRASPVPLRPAAGYQQGHGSGLWHVAPTGSLIAWIPLMIFAFLYGISMDYEVFMLSRIREAYDETGSTEKAIELGLARTGKLVTSGALILALTFLVLSSTPGYEVKSLAIGLAAGIIFDATVIRALLVPALMQLLGGANWWMPKWTGIVLRLAQPKPHVD